MITRLLDRYFAPVPYLRFITVRALVSIFIACYCIGRFRVLTDFSRFAPERFTPVGPVALFQTPVPHSVNVITVVATIVLAVTFGIGRFTKITGLSLALLVLWVTSYRNSWGMLFHTENLLALHVTVLAAASLFVEREVEDHDSVSGWPLRLMSAITVATYLLAGIAKLRNSGMAWLDGEILRNYIAFDCLRKAELASEYSRLGALMVQQTALFHPLAWATMALELGAPLALTHRYVRWTWIATAWGFHMGVQLIMWIGFPYPLSLIAYASLLPVERLWQLPLLSQLAKRLRLA